MYVLDFPIIKDYDVETIQGVCPYFVAHGVGIIRSIICDAR